MGKYVCGCVTFVKIQLKDGTFHEDMGYCNAEGNLKGLSIYFARIVCSSCQCYTIIHIIKMIFPLFHLGFSYRCV